ncbi:MAG: hypothetical protein IKV80_06645 [Bacteroidales bacterium]|nr:hypothetical protein [Bacteroidales bacterium]
MKRFLSFMLALAMLASMAISASAATTLYYAQDFSGYNTTDEVLADTANWKGNPSLESASTAVSKRDETNKSMLSQSSGIAGFSNSAPELVTDANGVNWFSLHNSESVGTVNAWFVVVPDNTWDYTAESAKDETYVISYDIKVNSRGVRLNNNLFQQTLWTDATSSNNATDYLFKLYKNDAASEAAPITVLAMRRQYDGYGHEYTLANDTAYKFSASYTPRYNASTGALEAKGPAKKTYVNGVTENNSGNAEYADGKPNLAALAIKYAYDYTMQFSNIKMYTIDNSEGFKVSRIGEGTIPTTGASVTVKFSQPVYAPTFDKNAVTIEGLTNGEDFLVSDVTEVVSGTDVYSTATVRFLSKLEPAADYDIVFPAATANEIAATLGANNTVTVSTPEPEVVVSNQIITKAWGTDAAATVSTFAADGVYGVSQDIKNNTSEAKDFAVIYAVYAGGKLADVVYTSENIAAGETTTIGTGVKLENVAGGQVKSFIWDGLTSIKPHTEASVWNIAE